MKIIRTLFITIIILCHNSFVKGQAMTKADVDSSRVMTTSLNDSLKMVGFLNLGKYFIDNNNDSSMFFAQNAYLLAIRIKSKEYEAQCYDFMGAIALRRGNTDQSVEYLLKAVKLFESLKDSSFLIVVNRNLGGVYKSQHDYSRAREYYANALSITPKSATDSLFYSWALMDMGDRFMSLNNPDSALYFARQSYDISMKLTLPYAGKYLPFALNTMGKIYQKSGKYEQALDKYRQAVKVAFSNFNLQAVSDNYMAIAMLFRITHVVDSGFYYAKKAFNIARQVNNPLTIEVSSGYLKDYFKDKRLLDSAFVYQEIMGEAKDSLLNLEKIRQVQNFAFDEQLEQEEIKAQLAEVRNNTKMQLVEYRNNAKMYVLLAGLSALVLVALLLLRNSRQNRRAKIEIETAYKNLKATQSQLIQSEKMASLGEMTAGIAHEIQNPLNFVNNFSEVNIELSEELKHELSKTEYVPSVTPGLESLVNMILENQQKIVHHGKRADAIVKSMLLHSRPSSGQKSATDLNALVEEYVRFSYNVLRAKEKSFDARIQTEYDPGIGSVQVISQDIGRVLLNLFNNAFYAASEKKKMREAGFEPTVTITTKKIRDKAVITVQDNGGGIPPAILDKIFQPFFTTKPTGQGTGLGLSLSYDIIKAHSGEIKVDTKEGEFTKFTLTLPA